MGTAANALVGATGEIYFDSSGTGTAPTNASGAPAVAFANLGYVSEDAVTQTIGSDTTELKAWGGTTIRKMQTSHTLEYQFALLENNPDALAAFYGEDNVDETLNVVTITATNTTRGRWIIDVLDGDNIIRIYVPDGEVTERGDVSFKTDELIAYPVTVTCYPDGSDVKAYQYMLTAAIS